MFHHHVVDAVQITRHTHGYHVVAIFGIERDVMTLFRFQFLITKTDLRLAAIQGEIIIIKLVETRCTETSGVGGTDIHSTDAVHEGSLGREVI